MCSALIGCRPSGNLNDGFSKIAGNGFPSSMKRSAQTPSQVTDSPKLPSLACYRNLVYIGCVDGALQAEEEALAGEYGASPVCNKSVINDGRQKTIYKCSEGIQSRRELATSLR